jgi:alpha-mannosidase
VFTTNLLKDEEEELCVLHSDSSDGGDHGCGGSSSALSLSFRGFEVKTVKLVLGRMPPSPKLSSNFLLDQDVDFQLEIL